MPQDCGDQQWQEGGGLDERTERNPAAVGAALPHQPRRAELQYGADHQRYGGNQPAGHLAAAQGQHEHRQIGLADADHDARCHSFGGGGAKIFSQHAVCQDASSVARLEISGRDDTRIGSRKKGQFEVNMPGEARRDGKSWGRRSGRSLSGIIGPKAQPFT